MVFIPAIIICEILYSRDDLTGKEKILRITGSCVATISGLLLVACLQAYQTGKWFYFIEIQKFWKRHWLLPRFPLTTYSPDRIISIDGISFIIGVAAIYFCVKTIIKRFCVSESSFQKDIFNNRALLFSMLCLAGTTLLDLLFTFNDKEATSIWSLNRHLFCAPFVLVFLSAFLYDVDLSENDRYFLFFLVMAGLLITGVFRYTLQSSYYMLFFFSLFVMKYYKALTPYLVLVYCINAIFQVQFFNNFLKDLWIG